VSDSGHLAAALLGLVLGALTGWLCPLLIAGIPEPEPEPEPEPDLEPDLARSDAEADAVAQPPERRPEPPKELYADIAALPGLAWKAAVGSALVGAVLGAGVGWEWSLLFLLPLAPVGVALGLVDWRTRLLPTRVVLPAHGVVLVLAGVAALLDHDGDAYVRALLAMVVLRSVFWVLWWIHSAGMGFGDVRLTALLGFALGYLGWPQAVVGIYAGFLLFVVPGVVVAVARRDRRFLKTAVPFGPFLLVGALVGVVLGPAVLRSLGY
jgi:leader peptidase (prepilin peptidase) / N-methyltransferase